MIELVTKCGHKFWASSSVIIRDKCYDMETLTDLQRKFVCGKLNEQALNAAYAGRLICKAEGIPTFEEAFGDG